MQKKIPRVLITLSILLLSFRSHDTFTKHGEHTYLVNADFQKGLTWMLRRHYAIAQNYFDAHIALTKGEVNNQRTIEAYYYTALSSMKLARVDGVERLQQFMTQFPSHDLANLAYYELGNFYCTQQDYATGIHYYLSVREKDLDITLQAAYKYRLAYAYLHEGDFEASLKLFNQCKKQENTPYTAASNYYASYLELKNEDYKNALDDLRTAQKHIAYERIVPYLILEVLYQSGNYQEAIDYAKDIKTKNLDCANTRDIALLTGESYFLLQDYKSAIPQYESYLIIAENDTLPDVKFRLGYALYATKEYHKAIKYFKELALQEDELGQLGSYYLGIAYMQTNQKNLALAALKQASKLLFDAKTSSEAAFQYAQLSYELGYETIALEALQHCKTTYPDSKHIHTIDKLLSQIYLETKNYDLAISHIDNLTHKNNTMRQVYQKATLYKGSTYFNQADYSTAIIWLKKSLAHPLDKALTAQTNFWLAESYAAQHEYEQAMPYYQTVIAHNAIENAYCQDACYGLAYVYFNGGAYQKALALFLQYAKTIKNEERWKIDALTRAADCYYTTKAYPQALALYEEIQNKNPDHSNYQQALIYTILYKPIAAKKKLEAIINADKHTLYYELALFDYAYLALQYQEYATAINYFTRLMQERPNHTSIPDALLYRAIAYVNLKQYTAAESDYITLLTTYPTHTAAENALLELPKLPNLIEDTEKLQQYIEIYKAKHPTNNKLQIIALEMAKNQFYSQNYQQAIEQLQAFITQYPESVKIEEAYFLLGEGYYRLEDMLQARDAYQKINNLVSPFYNKILLRIATIAYKQQEFSLALTNYQALHTRATSKKENYYALEGMMKSHAALQHYDKVKEIGKMIINLGAVTVNGTRQAILYSAKASIQQSEYQEALQQLQELTKEEDIYAAEAQFITAQIYYELGDYKQSLELLFALKKQHTNHKNLVEQAFLLIADNYIAQKETFQAKATLQSVIDHATDKNLVNKALVKLNELMQELMIQDNTTLHQEETQE